MSAGLNVLRRLRWVLCATAALALPVAQAQLRNCASLNSNPGDYKVVLDDFSFASPAASNDAELAALKERLQFNFNGQLNALKAAARRVDAELQVPLRLVVCTGRQPSFDGQEFTDALAESLSDSRVVVELWGSFDLRSTAGGAPARHATVGYAIPPVQHYHDDAEAPPIHVVAYPKSGSAVAAEELENLPELSAFALVGLATKAARARRYDLAAWAYTRAESGLLDAQLAGSNEGLDSLLVHVRRESCALRASARLDAAYTGGLKALPARACAGAP